LLGTFERISGQPSASPSFLPGFVAIGTLPGLEVGLGRLA
jgi:hypothetical protein